MNYTDKAEILKENLRELDMRANATAEQRVIILDELAKLICIQHPEKDPKELSRIFFSNIDKPSPYDAISICKEISCRPSFQDGLKRLLLIGSNEDTPAGSHGKIAYTKNKFNDLAIEAFVDATNNAKPISVPSNIEACETVWNGSCEFCLLPVENTRDGKIFSFYSMIERFELKICRVKTLDTDSELGSIRYALLSRSCNNLTSRAKRQEHVFEFSLISKDGTFIFDLLNAARRCNASLLSVDSRPVEYDTQLRRYFFSFLICDGPIFRIYVATSYPSYSPIGFYLK